MRGAWELVSQKSTYPNNPRGNFERKDFANPRVKILTDTHFAFGQQVDDSDEVTAGGGRYTLEGNTYTEIIEYHTSVPVGIRIPFECRIEGDTWYHTGYIGSGQYQLKLEEVWHRLK